MKLKIYDDYINEEIKKIKYDKKNPKKRPTNDLIPNYVLFILVFYCFFLPINSFSSHVDSRFTCGRLFPDTWKCKCGYDNYKGINRCGVCGKKRFST